MPTPEARLTRVLVAWATGALVVAALPLALALRARAVDEVRHEAELQMRMAQAVRRFTTDHVQVPLLAAAGADSFEPGAVPSFAASITMKALHERTPGVKYREVSFNPTNPGNLATGVDADLLHELQRGGVAQAERVLDGDAGPEMRIALPLKVGDGSCLRCHGDPAQAPAALLARYGREHGFGWHVGDIAGAQVVAVPMTEPLSRAWVSLGGFLAGGVVVVGALFVAMAVTLRRAVVDPMSRRHVVLERLAGEDELTGAANRRQFLAAGAHACAEAAATESPLAVMMMDIDHFKRVNDEHGHAAGDRVLREFVRRVGTRLRRCDVVGRLGGEEFALLLPGSDIPGSVQVAEALLAQSHTHPMEAVGRVTASYGVAAWRAGESIEQCLKRADAALYAAKRAGRARVFVAEGDD